MLLFRRNKRGSPLGVDEHRQASAYLNQRAKPDCFGLIVSYVAHKPLSRVPSEPLVPSEQEHKTTVKTGGHLGFNPQLLYQPRLLKEVRINRWAEVL